MARSGFRRCALVFVLSCAAGCTLLTSLDGFTTPDDAADGAPQGDGGPLGESASPPGNDGSVDAKDTGASDVTTFPDRVTFAPCAKADGGSIMIDAGGYCIDRYEVTQAQYKAFLDATISTTSQIKECRWNATFQPVGTFSFAGNPNRPVTGVDWCDAYAYCTYVGKRLCGKIGGGALPPTERSNGATSQWFAACTNHGDGRVYPYGSVFEAGVCNTLEAEAGVARPVGTFRGCEGGVPSVYDLSGNVGEWNDDCDVEQPDAAATMCTRRGGDFNNSLGGIECAYATPGIRANTNTDKGLRCCAD